MKTLPLVLSLITACSSAAPADPGLAQAEAAALCMDNQHLPSDNEIRQLLGDCVATSYGWQCTPCAVGGCEERYGGDDVLTHGHVWTSSTCILPGDEPGFYFADLYLGQIVCGHASEPDALQLCVR